MPEPTLVEQPKIAAEAMFGKESSARRRLTPEQRAAARLRAEVASDIAPQQILEGIAPHPAPNEGQINYVNNENTGTARKGSEAPDAGEKDYSADASAETRRKNVDRASKIAREILDKGYDNLTDDPDGFTADQKKELLVEQLKKVAMAWPQSRAVIESYGADEAAIRAKIEEVFLRNPHVLKQLSERFGQLYNGENAILKNGVEEAQVEYDSTAHKYKEKEAEVDAADKQYKSVDKRYRDLQPGGVEFSNLTRLRTESGGWPKRSQEIALELSRLDREINRQEGDAFETKTEIDRDEHGRETGRRNIKTRKSDVDAKIARAEERVALLRGEQSEISNKQVRLEALEKETAEVETKRNELAEKKAKLEAELANLDIDKSVALQKLGVQKAARAADEERFMHDVEGMFTEAGMRFMKEEVQRYEKAQKKIAEIEITKASDQDEKNILEETRRIWRSEVPDKKGRTKSVVNKNTVRLSYDRVMREGSPASLVKEFMSKGLNEIRTKYGVNSPEYKEEQARLNDRFNDSEFMNKMNALVGERLFKNHVESGGKIRKEDASVLVETDWGEAALEAGLSQNKKVGDLIDKLKEQGAFQGSRTEFLKKLAKDPKSYGVLAGIIALILGAPFLIAGAGVAAGGYKIALDAV